MHDSTEGIGAGGGEVVARDAEAAKPVQILVVDDHPVVREGLVGIISRHQEYAICGEAATIEGALDQARTKKPDLVLVDLLLKGQDGLELVRRLHRLNRSMPILVISIQDEELYAERALRAGASGYIMKDEVTENILSAIETLREGGVFLSKAMTGRIVRKYVDTKHDGEPELSQLTDRELHVFQQIALGLKMREIAEAMGLSVKTIETFRENIKKKLGIRSASELVRFAANWASIHGIDQKSDSEATPPPGVLPPPGGETSGP